MTRQTINFRKIASTWWQSKTLEEKTALFQKAFSTMPNVEDVNVLRISVNSIEDIFLSEYPPTPISFTLGDYSIHEFMGYEYISKNAHESAYENFGWWKKGTYTKDADPIHNLNFAGINAYNYREWNNLIPVIKKIKTLEEDFPMSEAVLNMQLWEDIETVYETVVEFINLYNFLS